MTSEIISMHDHLTGVMRVAFEKADMPSDRVKVETSRRPELADFQCNSVMELAAKLKQNPRSLAQKVVDQLKNNSEFAVSIAGPGFLNIIMHDENLAKTINKMSEDDRAGGGPTLEPGHYVIDFGGPNVAKAMHVGHLRTSIIGDCLQRLGRFLGLRITSDVHLGDWGMPMGMLICAVQDKFSDLPFFDENRKEFSDVPSPVTLKDLEKLYPQAAKMAKEDESFRKRCSAATAALQAGHAGFRALWQHFITVSQAGLKENFEKLDIRFDLWHGESTVHDLIEPMIEKLKSQGLAEHDQGSLIVRLTDERDEHGLPPLILEKSDGGVMYGTTDLATIINRSHFEPKPDGIIYVVDQRQHLHFQQVFRAAHISKMSEGIELEHVGFGTINGPDGKPFKTRSGGTMQLQELLEMAQKMAGERLKQPIGDSVEHGKEPVDAETAEVGSEQDTLLSGAERRAVINAVSLAAIKFADLSNDRLTNYIFDLDRFMRFEGKTGCYLLYATVRIQSILRRAKERNLKSGVILPPQAAEERALMIDLLQLPLALTSAWNQRAPNILCDRLYQLSQKLSRFYHSCPVLSEEDPNRRASRLSLIAVTAAQLRLMLQILGIPVPDRM